MKNLRVQSEFSSHLTNKSSLKAYVKWIEVQVSTRIDVKKKKKMINGMEYLLQK